MGTAKGTAMGAAMWTAMGAAMWTAMGAAMGAEARAEAKPAARPCSRVRVGVVLRVAGACRERDRAGAVAIVVVTARRD
eukprot:2649511-Prymnesium_polylepis.3